MKDKKKPLPPGQQQFMDDLPSKLIGGQYIACEIGHCGGKMMLLKDMNVFTYPDEPVFTTKAACIGCLRIECAKHGINVDNLN